MQLEKCSWFLTVKSYVAKPYNILLLYFRNVLVKHTQVIFVLNMLILVNGKHAFETFAHQVSVAFTLRAILQNSKVGMFNSQEERNVVI